MAWPFLWSICRLVAGKFKSSIRMFSSNLVAILIFFLKNLENFILNFQVKSPKVLVVILKLSALY